MNMSDRESSMKWKDQYGSPPCTNLFRSGAFYTEAIFFFKKPISMRRSTELSVHYQSPVAVFSFQFSVFRRKVRKNIQRDSIENTKHIVII
jgi:hypothetical protein